MSQIKQEQIKGLVRTEQQKGDAGRDKPYTAIMSDGRRVQLDAGEAKSLEKRLDKDRSRMEKEGTRAPEREQEKRQPTRVANERDRREFMKQFEKGR